MKKENRKKLSDILDNLSRNLTEHTFFTFLALLLIVLTLGGFLFYKYSVLVQTIEPEIKQEPIQFQENLYQKILEEWQDRKARFEEAESKYYLNPFQPGEREKAADGEKKLSEERTQELLANPQIQELLRATNLYEFYAAKSETFLTVEERAKIWQELELGREEEYQGSYNQNIKFLSELKKELTE